ncbi:unnamed protein product, partial [Clonostachys rosea f. rosea IK726]
MVFLPRGDPREQIYRWFRLLDKWKISNDDRPVKYRFMITCDDRRVETRQEARMSLKCEKGRWERSKKNAKQARSKEKYHDRALPSAYGFWLFPIDAFGMIPEAHPDIRHEGFLRSTDLAKPANVWTLKELWDLSIQKPELCLQHLPSRPQPNSLEEDLKRPSWRSGGTLGLTPQGCFMSTSSLKSLLTLFTVLILTATTVLVFTVLASPSPPSSSPSSSSPPSSSPSSLQSSPPEGETSLP